jgi:methionine salvage enolase-phosphatase E1
MNGNNEMVAAEIQGDSRIQVGERRALFPVGPEYLGRRSLASGYFDITSDDQRFLMVRIASLSNVDEDAVKLVLVQDWFEELKAKVGGNR